MLSLHGEVRGEGRLGVAYRSPGRQADAVLRPDYKHRVRVGDDVLKGQVYLWSLHLEDILERVLWLVQLLYDPGYCLARLKAQRQKIFKYHHVLYTFLLLLPFQISRSTTERNQLVPYLYDPEITVHHDVEGECLAEGGGADAGLVAQGLEVVSGVERL